MPLTPTQVETIRNGVRTREASRDSERIRGLDRIEITVADGLHYEAREAHGSDAVMTIDEPPERGGTGDGNSPLGHFLTGVGACLLNQFVRISIAEGYDLAFRGANVRGEFHRNPGGAFERITTEIRAEGSLDGADVEQLAERAEAFCYAHNTLKRTVAMSTVLTVNGTEVVRTVSGPV